MPFSSFYGSFLERPTSQTPHASETSETSQLSEVQKFSNHLKPFLDDLEEFKKKADPLLSGLYEFEKKPKIRFEELEKFKENSGQLLQGLAEFKTKTKGDISELDEFKKEAKPRLDQLETFKAAASAWLVSNDDEVQKLNGEVGKLKRSGERCKEEKERLEERIDKLELNFKSLARKCGAANFPTPATFPTYPLPSTECSRRSKSPRRFRYAGSDPPDHGHYNYSTMPEISIELSRRKGKGIFWKPEYQEARVFVGGDGGRSSGSRGWRPVTF